MYLTKDRQDGQLDVFVDYQDGNEPMFVGVCPNEDSLGDWIADMEGF